MEKVSIFDMDRTITRGGTFTPFLARVAARRQPWRLALFPLFAGAMVLHALGLLERKSLKEFGFRLLIGPLIAPAELSRHALDFARSTHAFNTYRGALCQIEADREAGFMLVLATAAPDFYADKIGEALGFDAVIATRHRRDDDGNILAQIDGENCYGSAKLERIRSWLREAAVSRDQATLRFYSDHISDMPTFRWADAAIAVNPRHTLRDLALKNRWTVVTFA